MNSIYKRVSRIENFFSMLLTRNKVSDNIFIGYSPTTLESEFMEFVVVDILKIKDYGAYAQGNANIFLYAKATDNMSSKPVKRLNKMEEALDKAIKSCNDKNYSIEEEFRDSGYDTNRNYHYNVISIKVTIRRLN